MKLIACLFLAAALPAFAAGDDGNCSFFRGTTTCTSESTRSETTTVAMYSGCQYGPTGIPGRRTRTFENTYLIVDETTTLAHGQEGPVYSSSTAEIGRTLESSVLISDVCEVL